MRTLCAKPFLCKDLFELEASYNPVSFDIILKVKGLICPILKFEGHISLRVYLIYFKNLKYLLICLNCWRAYLDVKKKKISYMTI